MVGSVEPSFFHLFPCFLSFPFPKLNPLISAFSSPSSFIFVSSSPFLLLHPFIINCLFFQKKTNGKRRDKRKGEGETYIIEEEE